MTLPLYLDELKAAADGAAAAEDQFRRDILPRTRALERERAFAFRRLNFMNAIAGAVASADSADVAVLAAVGMMRARLGWVEDSDARDDVADKFVPVALAMYAAISPKDDEAPPDDEAPKLVALSTGAEEPPPDVGETLTRFEAWYEATHPNAFWVLFENVMPETPVVDF